VRIHKTLAAVLPVLAFEAIVTGSAGRADDGHRATSIRMEGIESTQPEERVVRVEDDRLTVSLREVPLERVLSDVGRASGIAILLDAPAPEAVTASFTLPLDRGLRRILGERSFTFTYAGDPRGGEGHAEGATPRLTSVRVLARLPRIDAGGAGAHPGSSVSRSDAPTPTSRSLRRSGARATDIEPLAQVLGEAGDGERRADAAAALGRTWSGDAVDPLSEAIMEDEDSAVRLAAVEALGRTWEDGTVEPLALALLGDPDVSVREGAAQSLGESWSDAAVGPLADALLEDPHWQVRDRAAHALGEIGSTNAIPPLMRALNDADGSVRESAALALSAIGSGR